MSYFEQGLITQTSAPGTFARLRRDFVMPLATIAGLIVLVLVVGIHFGVRALDEESAAREMQLVKNGLSLRVEEVAELVVPQADWDDAVRNLDNRFDPAWASSNINEFLDHAYGFDGEVVLDSADKPLFAAFDGKVVAPGEFSRISSHAQELVRAVRRKEVARGPLRRLANGDLISKAVQSSTLKAIDGQLTILTATLIQPDFGTAMPSGPRSPILVTAMRVDQPFLAQFSQRFLLNDVRARLPGQVPAKGRIEIPVRDDKGTIQTWLTWQPLDPGYGMLHRIAFPFFGAMLLVMILVAVELRRIFRAARELIARDELAEFLLWPIDEQAAGPDEYIKPA